MVSRYLTMGENGNGGGNGNGEIGRLKGQPWILYDTVAAASFLAGDTVSGLAIGTQIPAISRNGEMTFFSAGRTKAGNPQLTNLDLSGQLSYGFQVWQIYIALHFPTLPPAANNGFSDAPTDVLSGIPPTTRLGECFMHYASVEMTLGQEEQASWPVSRFGAGGGLHLSGDVGVHVASAQPQMQNVLVLPEPISMVRTQNMDLKIRLSPEALEMIGTPGAPGVGFPLAPYDYRYVDDGVENDVALTELPFAVQVGLVGRRVKQTQYGDVPGSGPNC